MLGLRLTMGLRPSWNMLRTDVSQINDNTNDSTNTRAKREKQKEKIYLETSVEPCIKCGTDKSMTLFD